MNAHSFFTELQRLLSLYPHIPPQIFNSEMCDVGDMIYYCKDPTYCFDCAQCQNSVFLYDSYQSVRCFDCDYCVESELCYESVDAYKCFNGFYTENCGRSRDIWYSYNCINCANVFGCVNLQNKSFCIFNRQLTENEYWEKIKLYQKVSPENILAEVEKLKKRYPLTQTNESHNENSEYGNFVAFNRNCYICFDAAHNENCCYLYDSFYNKACFDMTYGSQNNQLSYEIVDSGNLFNCNFAVLSNNCQDSNYIFNCQNVKNCFGCVNLQNKEYCILNRQLTKENYLAVKEKILHELQKEKSGWDILSFI